MFHAVPDFAEDSGDTQLIDTQLYTDAHEPDEYQPHLTPIADTPGRPAPDTSLDTPRAGDRTMEGLVGLDESLRADIIDVPRGHNDGEVEISSLVDETEERNEHHDLTSDRPPSDRPAAASFLTPMTPFAAGRKHNAAGDIIGSTPVTWKSTVRGSTVKRKFRGAGVGLGVNMSLTQAFETTQVASSSPPPQGGIKSDPVFERPSPNLRMMNTSPPPAIELSSPVKGGPGRDTEVALVPEGLPDFGESPELERIRGGKDLGEGSGGKQFSSLPANTPSRFPGNFRPSPAAIPSQQNARLSSQTVEEIQAGIQVPMTSSKCRQSQRSNAELQQDIQKIFATPEGDVRQSRLQYHPREGSSSPSAVADSQGDVEPRSEPGPIQQPSELSEPPLGPTRRGARAIKRVVIGSSTQDSDEEHMASSPPTIQRYPGRRCRTSQGLVSSVKKPAISGPGLDNDASKEPSRSQPAPNTVSIMAGVELTQDFIPGASRRVDQAEKPLRSSLRKSLSSTQPSTGSKSPATGSHAQIDAQRKTSQVRRLADIAAEDTAQLSFGSVDLKFNLMNDEDEEFLRVTRNTSPLRPSQGRSRKKARKSSLEEQRTTSQKENDETMLPNTSAEAHQVQPSQPKAQLTEEVATIAEPPTKPAKPILPVKRPCPTVLGAQTEASTKQPSSKQLKLTQKPKKCSQKFSKPQIPQSHKASLITARQVSATENGEVQERETGKSTANCSPAPPITLNEDSKHDIVETPQKFSNRVFAFLGGKYMTYYPATCLGPELPLHKEKYRVRFEDGTVVSVEASHLRTLELRVGDVVRVDLQHLNKRPYVVHGFSNRLHASENDEAVGENWPSTDIKGHQSVKVAPKGRDSGPVTLKSTSAHDLIEVPISSIKIPNLSIHKFHDRMYTPTVLKQSISRSRFDTPSAVASIATTPSSRSHHLAASHGPQHDSMLHASSYLSTSAVFANMLFALTFTEKDKSRKADERKSSCTKIIKANGGTILEDGFHELFEGTTCAAPSNAGPSRRRSGQQQQQQQQPNRSSSSFAAVSTSAVPPTRTYYDDDDDDLPPFPPLKPPYHTMGFAALISDTHSRRTKHMQALALNLPILHHRWVSDSVRAGRALPWSAYLLPAGESSFLDGAIASRSLRPYHPLAPEAALNGVLERRAAKPMEGWVVGIVEGARRDRWSAFGFLVRALGAAKVRRVGVPTGNAGWDAREGKGERVWDLVLCEEGVRGRVRREVGSGVRVERFEFVVQSLIVGQLVD